MPLDEVRCGAALLIGAILTAVVTSGGYLISELINPNYQYSMYDIFLMTLFIAFCFIIQIGFFYFI